MNIGQAEIFGKFAVGDGEIHGVGQTVADSIIDAVVSFLIAIESWRDNGHENDDENREEFDNVTSKPVKIRE